MEEFTNLKKANYRKNVCSMMENGVIDFNPTALNDVVGAEKMSYDEFLDVQFHSLGKIRTYFEMCYFNVPIEFNGQVERISKDKVCFNRIYVCGMYPDGEMFDGKEDHVWMQKTGFETAQVGDCFSFHAEVYRYIKTGNGKQLDYALKLCDPKGVKKIDTYELPSDDDLLMQSIESCICETCFLNEQCNRLICFLKPQQDHLRDQWFDIVRSKKHDS